jgi:orotate phosphoribosyltransferase
MAVGDRAKLLNLLAKYSYSYKPEGIELSSGKLSHHYIDCKKTVSHSESMEPMGALFLERVIPAAVAVGGLTMGADPVALNVVYASIKSRPLLYFSVRKGPKKHGLKKLVEGDVPQGSSVVVVDDVVTTGGSTMQAIDGCRNDGLNVVQVLVLVDREEEDGLQKIKAKAGPSVSVEAMFTMGEIRREWESQQQTLRATA